jgi:hypothetical protein
VFNTFQLSMFLKGVMGDFTSDKLPREWQEGERRQHVEGGKIRFHVCFEVTMCA